MCFDIGEVGSAGSNCLAAVLSNSRVCAMLTYQPDDLGGLPIDAVVAALRAEGCLELDQPSSTRPLNEYALFGEPSPLFPWLPAGWPRYQPGQHPNAERLHRNTLKLTVPHDDEDLADAYVLAFEKVLVNHTGGSELMTPTELTSRDAADGVEQEVVGAVIGHGGRVLLLRRPIEDFRGGTWELPSGKVEPGEDLITALHREVTEETGLTVTAVTAYLGAFDYTSGSGKRCRRHTWSVTPTGAERVRLSEHDAHAWIGRHGEYPVSAEVKALLAEHFASER